jgi:hypothetical protein
MSADTEMMREMNLEFRGEQLGPFNFHRKIAADALGLHLYRVPSDEREAMAKGAGAYHGFFGDALLIVFLCLSPNSLAMKAQRAPDIVREQFNAWGESLSINPASEDGIKAAEIFSVILEGIQKSEAKQVLPPEETELGKPRSKKK